VFGFHPDVALGENNADLVVLVMLDIEQFFVFPFDHPVFICQTNKYGRIGQRKVGVSYRLVVRSDRI
jgi:hypothetical protein